jgi:hypothetical protein
MRPIFRLLLHCLFVTVGALGVVFCLCLFWGPQMSGLFGTSETAAQFIRERNHFFLVRPEWISGAATLPLVESGADWRWLMTEIKARMGLVFVAYVVCVSLLVRGYLRQRAKALTSAF